MSSPDEPHLSSNFDAIRATHGNNCRSLAGVILRSLFCDIYSWACSAILPLGSWFSTQLLLFQILDYSIDIYPLKPHTIYRVRMLYLVASVAVFTASSEYKYRLASDAPASDASPLDATLIHYHLATSCR